MEKQNDPCYSDIHYGILIMFCLPFILMYLGVPAALSMFIDIIYGLGICIYWTLKDG